jgi:hypothetical protein
MPYENVAVNEVIVCFARKLRGWSEHQIGSDISRKLISNFQLSNHTSWCWTHLSVTILTPCSAHKEIIEAARKNIVRGQDDTPVENVL